VTLEQVAPKVGSRVTYTYDFGDNWEHEIVVEKVLEPAEATVSTLYGLTNRRRT
jgi:hypothetical protein